MLRHVKMCFDVLRCVKMCTVQSDFDMMCASIVFEPKEHEGDKTAPYSTFSWPGLSTSPLYVSTFRSTPGWFHKSQPVHHWHNLTKHMKNSTQKRKHQKKTFQIIPPHPKLPQFSCGKLWKRAAPPLAA